MSAFYLLLLLASCTGSSPFDTDTSNPGDADTDADSDTDSDSDADTDLSATFDVVLPTSGATVMVNEVEVPCTNNVCTVSAPDDGTFVVTVTHPMYFFIPKTVVVTDGVPNVDQVTYATGGCADDPDYDGTYQCNDWQMSEYAPNIAGTYCDDQDRCYDAVTTYGDIDYNGVDELWFYLDGLGGDFNVSGSVMIEYTDGVADGYGYVSSDLSTITVLYVASSYQKVFTLD